MKIRELLAKHAQSAEESRKIFDAHPALKHLLQALEFLQTVEVRGNQAKALGDAICFIDELAGQVMDEEVADGEKE